MTKRWCSSFGVAVLMAGVIVVYWFARDEGGTEEEASVSRVEILDTEIQEARSAVENMSRPRALEGGDEVEDVSNPRLLRHYGEESRTALNDLQLVEEVLQRFWLFYKDPDLLLVGSSEDVLSCLLGGNPEGIAFVSPDNRYIDREGRLLDRWGTPLFFHAESMTRIEVRSSGPDGRRFTDDDVVVVAGSGTRLKR